MKENEFDKLGYRGGLQVRAKLQPRLLPSGEGMADKSETAAKRPWTLLWSQKWLLISCAVACALVSFGVSFLQTPEYRAQTSLEIEDLNNHFLQLDEVDPVARGGNADSFMSTQVDMLTSNALLSRVITRLNMDTAYRKVPSSGGSFETLKEKLSFERFAESPKEAAIADVKSRLTINALRGTSRVVTIEYTASDPHLAADFPNTLAQEFIDQGVQLRMQSAHRLNAWLVQELEQSRQRLQQSEDELQKYGQAAGLLFTDEKNSVAQTRLRELQDELARAEADRMTKQSTYELIRNAGPDNLGQISDDKTVEAYQLKLTDLRRELADAEILYTPKHYKVTQLVAQISKLEAALAASQRRGTNRLASEYYAAQRREALLQQAYVRQTRLVSTQDAKASHYNVLKNEAETNRQLYTTMLARVKGVDLASAMRASNIAIFDPAEVPSRPFKPQPAMNAEIGLISGLLLGLIYVFLRDRWDQSVRLPGEMAAYLNVPELGAVPRANKTTLPAPPRPPLKLIEGQVQHAEKIARSGITHDWVTDGHSQLADSFKAILASVLLSDSGSVLSKVIVVTSPSAEEGKTTIATNLAVALAGAGKNVLLIDADLRKPRLHQVFGIRNDTGFSDLLIEESQSKSVPSQYIQSTNVRSLRVLTTGRKRISASNLIYGSVVRDLFARLRHDFDFVLIDTAPMLPVADARVMSLHADGVVLVCRAGATQREKAQIAVNRLLSDGAHVIGTVLNDFDPRRANHNSYYAQSYSWSELDQDRSN